MREKDVEKILVAEIRKMGGKAYKWVSPGNDGVPDRIVVLPEGRLIFVELKADTGRLRELQKKQIGTLRGLGQDVRVVYGPEGLCRFFRDIGNLEAAEHMRKKLESGKR